MLRLEVVCLLFCICALAVIAKPEEGEGGEETEKHGGKGGHAGKGGHGHHGGGAGHHEWGFYGLGKDAYTVLCKDDNLKDDKFEEFKAEVEKCDVDSCSSKADDITLTGLTKVDNKHLAQLSCSQKYKTCTKEKISHFAKKGKGHAKMTDEQKKEFKEKLQKKKDCIKKAFEKIFGAIAASAEA